MIAPAEAATGAALFALPGDRLPPFGKRVVIATHNAGKLREMTELLAPYAIETVSAGALGLPEPNETGMMFAENAALKADASAIAANLPAIADDSGLCVDALDGAPGIFTADWAGHPRDFSAAMARVARELESRGHAATGARAHFVSALVVSWPNPVAGGAPLRLLAEGRVHGTLVFPPRGTAGFGYDPIFLPDGESRTFGEMEASEKHGLSRIDDRLHGLSHRARAFIRLVEALGLEPVEASR